MRSEARHRAREVALQVLFALDLQRAAEPELDAGVEPGALPGPTQGAAPAGSLSPSAEPDAVFADVSEHFELPAAAREFARALVVGAAAQRASLDGLIGEHARNWRVDRMAVVDRNVLRLATYELVHTDTATPVVLDEAVELAHRFGGDPSPKFVNGVLDALAHAVRG